MQVGRHVLRAVTPLAVRDRIQLDRSGEEPRIGVRLTMGSPRSRLLRLVVSSPPQTSLVIGAATTLFVSTLAASLLPAWRAARYDPAIRRE